MAVQRYRRYPAENNERQSLIRQYPSTGLEDFTGTLATTQLYTCIMFDMVDRNTNRQLDVTRTSLVGKWGRGPAIICGKLFSETVLLWLEILLGLNRGQDESYAPLYARLIVGYRPLRLFDSEIGVEFGSVDRRSLLEVEICT